MEQAQKEACALWCHNALQQSYEPVWVVLTDLSKVLRVTYCGDNYSGGPGQPFKKGMQCIDVRGTIRYTDDYPFILRAGQQLVAHSAWDSAVQCFVGGLQGQRTAVSADEFQQRLDQHAAEVAQQVQECMRQCPRPSKKAK